ncbi:MAG: hypothetical protein M1818_001698 [Claussenomyces sp. TS43310]|nr:MAG: hypothetical protein M1818_001698 [Claussenomyces sp. TS43310]
MSAEGGRNYYYHLKFELYLSPPTRNHSRSTQAKKSKHQDSKTKSTAEIWLPPAGTDIFSASLPTHSTSSARSSGPRSEVGNQRAISGLPSDEAKLRLRAAQRDWRYGAVRLESMNMDPAREHAASSSSAPANDGSRESTSSRARVDARPGTQSAKARFQPLGRPGQNIKNTELGWGIVHLYRDGEETLPLKNTSSTSFVAEASTSLARPNTASKAGSAGVGGDGEDTTILCIPAVPSYMLPSDFLGWVGEKTRDQVSHFRMVMTERMNRYLVLMKFRDAAVARKWRQEWDGKVFNGMEPENCHVMFIKSIVFDTPSLSSDHQASFPDMSHDPFTPAMSTLAEPTSSLAFKPFPPPTPSLVELPTCPVCLERMDDTTGLLTIICQHVFHCACLQKWRGSGCPVCRHTQPSPSLGTPFGARPVGARSNDLCAVCDCPDDLWICLICGNVGCGRYKGGHAKEHFKETAHCYALEIETQYVWDYAGDIWVHRLIQTKGDGKLVELPSNSRTPDAVGSWNSRDRGADGEDEVEMVPRVKLENIGMEYTHLLTSQLESQRVYFEEVVKKAVDKASAASQSAEAAAAKAEEAMVALEKLSVEHKHLRNNIVPSLERERDRMTTKAEKTSEVARAMTRSFQEEKQVGKGLMQRIEHVNEAMAKMSRELGKMKEENEDLREQNRDLSFFISSQEKLKELSGPLGEEVTEGTVSLPERKELKGKGKGKGKSK